MLVLWGYVDGESEAICRELASLYHVWWILVIDKGLNKVANLFNQRHCSNEFEVVQGIEGFNNEGREIFPMLGTNHIEVRAVCEHRGLFQSPLLGFAPLKSVIRFGIWFVILILALPLLGKQVIFS
jgi:hypothetical protein